MLELEDLTKYHMLSDPQISPDAKKICFMITKHRLNKNDYETSLWLKDRNTDNVFQLTTGLNDTFPKWDPTSKRIIFTAKRNLKSGESGNELWIIPTNGGEAQHLLTQKGGISNVRWSPDGQKLLFLSTVSTQTQEEGVRIIQGLPLHMDGHGYVNNWRRHLFTFDVISQKITQLTHGALDVHYAEFANNGKNIAYVIEEGAIRTFGSHITDLKVIPSNGGCNKKLTSAKIRIGALTWSPNDHQIAFNGCDHSRGVPTHEDLFVISADGQDLQNLTKDFDLTIKPSVYCDVIGPFNPVQNPVWINNYIYFLVSERGAVNIHRISPLNGQSKSVISGNSRIGNFSISEDVIAFSQTTPTNPTELWIKEGEMIKTQTNFNNWLREYRQVIPESFEFSASDGVIIDGWIMRPHHLEEGKTYPMILQCHGGPKSVWGQGYLNEFQYLTASGYVIAYVNSRGSGGYSQEFADIRGHYGERDYHDLMEAVDFIIANFPFVDSQRLGVTGISYGGFITNWIVGHTDRFKAAVTQAGISNWYSFFGTTDGGGDRRWQMGGDPDVDPWTAEELYLEKSPIRHVKNVKAATMIMQWQEDYRVPVEQAVQFYTALQYLGIESELVLLTGSPHAIFVVGKPRIKIAKIKHLKRWFDKYLQD